MDPSGYMCKKTGPNAAAADEAGASASRNALSIIASMRRRLRMADGWFKTINRVHRYYVRVKKDFQRNVHVLGGPSAPPGPLSIREGGIGGGLEEFKMIEATLKEFGSLDDQDVEMTDAHEPELGRAESSLDAASTGVKSEIQYGQEKANELGTIRYDQWNAINSGAGLSQHTESVPTTNGSYHGIRTPSAASPSAATPVYRRAPGSGEHTSPMPSPAVRQHQLPPFPPHQTVVPAMQASATLQHQMQAAPPLLSPPMTAEQTEAWLRNLDTAFTGDDLSAFVDGRDWQTWVNEMNTTVQAGSWLNTVWSNPL